MRSMTGFGRAEQQIESTVYTFEVKSLNHRYLDIRFRLPPQWQNQEIAFAQIIRSRVNRGSLDVTLRQRLGPSETVAKGGTRFIVDPLAAKTLMEACEWLHKNHHTPQLPSLELMERTGKVFLTVEQNDAPANADLLQPLLRAALDDLLTQRKREGQQTSEALQAVVGELKKIANQCKNLASGQAEGIRQRLLKRLEQWNVTADAQRLELEVALAADKADISEEIQRLEAHLEEFRLLLQSDQPVGRKLEFLTQELHREANTIASKSDNLELSKLTVAARTAVEKLREQVQNVE